MSVKSPAFQFYPNEWLGSTKIMLMTPAEEGAYIRLLCVAWNDPKCSLPANDDELAVLSRLGEGWFNGGSTKIKACFKQRGKRLYNDRLLAERKKQQEWREKSRAGGQASANARKQKANQGKGGSRVVQPDLIPNGNSSSSSSSSINYTNVMATWNGLAKQEGLSLIQRMTDKRKKKYAARIKECGEVEFWDNVKREVGALNSFARGENGWRLDFDFVVRSDENYTKLIEGNYRGKTGKPASKNGRPTWTH